MSSCGCAFKDYDYLKGGARRGSGGEGGAGAAGAEATPGGAGGAGGGSTSTAGSAGGGQKPGHAGHGGLGQGIAGGTTGAEQGGKPASGGEGGAGAPASSGEGGVGMPTSGGEGGVGMPASGGEGGAGAPASGGQGATAAGAGGEGPISCGSGLTLCEGDQECIELAQGKASGDTVIHCGTCDVVCSLNHAASATCSSGECVPECSSGYEDCNSAADNDGCETNITVVSDCGACGRECSVIGAASMDCVGNQCTPGCLPGFADCNTDDGVGDDDGCEVYLDDLNSCATTCGDGVACEPSEVCNGGVCGAPQGLVRLSVPFTEADQYQRYGVPFSGPHDLTVDTVILRVYAPGATGGRLDIYLLDAVYNPGSWVGVPMTVLAQGWTDIEVPIINDFDPSLAIQVSIHVFSENAASWTNPTVVYVDSIRSMSSAFNYTFDADFSPMVISTTQIIEGSTMTWVDAVPDSPAGGAGGAAG